MDPAARELLSASASLRSLVLALAGDEHLAGDLVQDAWVAALRRRDRPPRRPALWARGVVRRLLQRTRESERRRREVESLAAEEGTAPPADQELGHGSFLEVVARAAAALDEPYRTVIRLRYWEDLSPPQIAERLGRPRETVKTQLRRGLELLRRQLDGRHGGERAAWLAPLRLYLDTSGPGLASAAAPPWILVSAAVAAALVLVLARTLPAGGSRAAGIGPLQAARPESAPALQDLVAGPRVAAPLHASAGVASSSAAADTRIRVTVVDDLGRPVPGARIRVLAGVAEARELGRSDADGAFELEVLDAYVGAEPTFGPRVVVTASCPGHADAPWFVLSCPPGSTQDLRVELSSRELVVEGTVTDAAGAPIPQAVVERALERKLRTEGELVLGEGVHRARTDAAGAFTLAGLSPGTHLLTARAEGFVPTRQSVQGASGGLVECPLMLTRAAGVSGVVRDARGDPVAGAVLTREPVAHGRFVVRSGPDGRYEIDDLLPGQVHLWAQDADCSGLLARATIEVEAGQRSTWDPVLERAEGISVRVVDERGAARAGWIVVASSGAPGATWERTQSTDAEGRSAFFDLPPTGPLQVEVSPVVQAPFPRGWRAGIRPGDGEVVVAVADSVPSGSVHGALLAASGGPPAGATVRLRWGTLAESEHVDPASGRFAFRQVPDGRYDLELVSPAHGSFALGPVELTAGESIALGSVRLPPAGRARVDWSWPAFVDGRRVRYVLRQHSAADTWTVVAEGPAPPPDGFDLLPGSWSLAAEDAGPTIPARFTVEPGGLVLVSTGPAPAR